jgi:hypothetical protein
MSIVERVGASCKHYSFNHTTCTSACLKLKVHLFGGEPNKTGYPEYLAGFLVRSHTWMCLDDL